MCSQHRFSWGAPWHPPSSPHLLPAKSLLNHQLLKIVAMCLLETENSLTYQPFTKRILSSTWIKKTTNSNTKNAHPGIKHSCTEANFVGVFFLWLHRSVDPGRGILWMNHCLNLETFRANSWAPFCFMGCVWKRNSTCKIDWPWSFLGEVWNVHHGFWNRDWFHFKSVGFLWTCSSSRQIWPPKRYPCNLHANWLPWHMELLDSARWSDRVSKWQLQRWEGFCHMTHPMEMCESCETCWAAELSPVLEVLPNQRPKEVPWKHMNPSGKPESR